MIVIDKDVIGDKKATVKDNDVMREEKLIVVDNDAKEITR